MAKKQCKLCNKNRSLIKAHIIPRAFFPRSNDPNIQTRILPYDDASHIKRAPKGPYDKLILCSQCDNKIGEWDNYAVQLFGTDPSDWFQYGDGNEIVGYRIDDYNYENLKLFFLSLLWRASVSKLDFFSNVRLKEFEPRLAHLIRDENPGEWNEFPVMLLRFTQQKFEAKLNPIARTVADIQFQQFFLGEFVAYIRTGTQVTKDPFAEFYLAKEGPLTVMAMDLDDSKDVNLMKNIVKKRHGLS